MIKTLLMWLALSASIAWGITTINHMTGKEVWSMTKTLTFSLLCSMIAIVLLVGIVIIF